MCQLSIRYQDKTVSVYYVNKSTDIIFFFFFFKYSAYTFSKPNILMDTIYKYLSATRILDVLQIYKHTI